MSKRSIIVMLAGANLLLLAALILTAYSPPAAYAQGVGRSGEYILVAAEAEVSNDAIYLLDLRAQQLHAFRTTFPRMGSEAVRMALLHTRDLARDFGG